MIVLSRHRLQKCAVHRRIAFEDLRLETADSDRVEVSYEVAASIAERLIVPLCTLMTEGETRRTVIKRGTHVESCLKEVDGVPAYLYRRVLATAAEPGLSVYRTTLFPSHQTEVPLNDGHLAAELVYVLEGDVECFWADSGNRRCIRLAPGDTMFLASCVRHAFRAADRSAEILAIDLPLHAAASRGRRRCRDDREATKAGTSSPAVSETS